MPRTVIQGNPMDPDPFEIVIRDEDCASFPDTYLIVVKPSEIPATETTTRPSTRDRRVVSHGSRSAKFSSTFLLVARKVRRTTRRIHARTRRTRSNARRGEPSGAPYRFFDLRFVQKRAAGWTLFTLRHPQNDRVTPKTLDQDVLIMPKRRASGSTVAHARGAAFRCIGGAFMCGEQIGGGTTHRFDPTRCPLLQGLSSEEADRMMRTDPRIRACIAASESGAAHPEPCVAKMVRAHDARAARVA